MSEETTREAELEKAMTEAIRLAAEIVHRNWHGDNENDRHQAAVKIVNVLSKALLR